MGWLDTSIMRTRGLSQGRTPDVHALTEAKQGKYHYTIGPYSDPVLQVQPGDRIGVTSPSSGVGSALRPRLEAGISALRERGCRLIGVDQFRPASDAAFDEFHVTDLNVNPFPRALGDVQVVLVLDIIEHLISPEKFCVELRQRAQSNLDVKIIISTGNVEVVAGQAVVGVVEFGTPT